MPGEPGIEGPPGLPGQQGPAGDKGENGEWEIRLALKTASQKLNEPQQMLQTSSKSLQSFHKPNPITFHPPTPRKLP
jgi:hypothetical protein